jgi:uncharacterized low-complexity protein
MSHNILKPAVLAASAVMLGSFALAGSAFAMTPLAQGYQVTAPGDDKAEEGKCGEGSCGAGHDDKAKEEGKCGEGKCGEGRCGGDKADGKAHEEGKCGEGQCGADKKAEAADAEAQQ